MHILQTLSYIDYCLFGALLLVFGYQCYFYCRYMTGVNRWLRRHRKQASDCPPLETLPGVSVIVCARNEETNLHHYLHTLLTQDYPCFEVIVVNDGSEDHTQAVLEQYAREYKHLHLSFVPHDARIISSKKLALTIGAKAAQYDYLLLTDADCRPESRFWIREMIQGFLRNDHTEVVLGFGAYFAQKSWLNSIINFDTLFIGLQYLGMAEAGHPYMGVGRNLAYRRDTFFRHSGFRGLLGERAGDDDLFVNKVTTSANTQIVCTPDSITWSVPKNSWREWFHQKRRHLSVSPHYKMSSKVLLTIEPLTRGLLYALLIAIFIFATGWTMVAAYALWWIRLILQLCIINTASRRLGGQMFGIEIVVYELFLPLVSAYMLCTQPLYRRRMHW